MTTLWYTWQHINKVGLCIHLASRCQNSTVKTTTIRFSFRIKCNDLCYKNLRKSKEGNIVSYKCEKYNEKYFDSNLRVKYLPIIHFYLFEILCENSKK